MYSIPLTDKDIGSINRDKSYYNMPLNLEDIRGNFDNTFRLWNEEFNNKLNIVRSSLLNHITNQTDIYEHYILLLTSLEKVSIDHNDSYKENTKYDWPINSYSTEYLTKKLTSFNPNKNKESLGKYLSDLRALIVHPKALGAKKFEKYKGHISMSSIGNVSEILFLILLNSFYHSIQLSPEAIRKVSSKSDSLLKSYIEFRR